MLVEELSENTATTKDYKDADNWLIMGDCLDRMKEIPDGSVDMVLADPPYGTTACKWDSVIDLGKMWEQLKRIIKSNGAIVMTATEPFTSVLCISNIKNLREKLVWVKHKPSNFACGKIMHLKYHEDITVFAGKKPTYNPQMQQRKSDRISQMQRGKSKKWSTVRNDGNEVSMLTQYEPKSWSEYDSDLKYPSTVIKISAVGSNSAEKVNHPTQKPVALMEYLIKTYTNEGETVLDFTMGSGTTGVACANTNRKFIGIEKDEKYFNIAKDRILNTLKEPSK
jgi:site-specific DNA-methyltransferase (adenine-specific)